MPEKVYISSTYLDLKNFRQAIIKSIVNLGDYYKPVSMEFYDAEDVHFAKKCLDDVEACDVYILILGKRYGYIPKGFQKSITELEYEKARACQQEGRRKEILVFKVGDLCNAYNYKENIAAFVEYQQDFLDDVTERLSPKAFESEAELELQVTNALMKRLFKLIKKGEKIIPPDKDALLCYCDRTVPINALKTNVLFKKKRIFFIQGNRKTDYPAGIVKRFAKYSLGSFNKIEPLIKITDLITSLEPESNNQSAFIGILTYINSDITSESCSFEGLLQELTHLKSKKVILPFYYDFDFEEDSVKFKQFLDFTHLLFTVYQASIKDFELYFITFIYSQQPDYQLTKTILKDFNFLDSLSTCLERLRPVDENDIIDWIERFITTIEYSPSLYDAYFEDKKDKYQMQEVNLKLTQIIEDLGNGEEKIKKIFINTLMLIQLTELQKDYYQPTKELLAAINTALFLRRPLLLTGEPGTGKTECANFIARQLKKSFPQTFVHDHALRFNTKSVSQATDLFYTYDAVAHFGDKTEQKKESFISLNTLGAAILCTHPAKSEWEKFGNYQSEVADKKPPFGSVVLIDEIDKAPRDFPNDLLAELEKPPFKFAIKEVSDFVVTQNPYYPIIIIVTSNNEKGLPDAFLRRCLFHYINFPEDSLLDIVKVHLQLENQYVETAIAKFLDLRKNNIAKKPATSELIDWIACLQQRNLLNENLANWKQADGDYKQRVLETLGILAKSKVDFETLSKEVAG